MGDFPTTPQTLPKGATLTWQGATSGGVTVGAAASGSSYSVTFPSAQAAANQMLANDGAGNLSWVNAGGCGLSSRVTSQFNKTTDTTLANIPGLSVALTNGRTYRFVATLHVTADATGGHKYAMAGTATASQIVYQIDSIRNDTNVFVINSRQTALAGAAGAAGGTTIITRIEGTITVSGAGTLTVQFAENASSGTSSVLAGSTLMVEDIT